MLPLPRGGLLLGLAPEFGSDVCAPLAQLVDGEDVVQALHPLRVLDRRQPGGGPADGPGRRVGIRSCPEPGHGP
ncbi:hypothetical protein [Brachybacterium sacelli]|uniref:hypothetical protein n=1 Tax=Brachybacterium sacelli TaxID=173364 RepID=UPI00361C1BE6